MSSQEQIKEQITKEFDEALLARRQGNEGKVRVCVRRGVAIAIADFYSSRGVSILKKDVIDLLKIFLEDDTINESARQAAVRISSRITPHFQYAHPTDPLEDAQLILDYIRDEGK